VGVKKNALLALCTVNAIGLIAVVGLQRTQPEPTSSPTPSATADYADRVAQLEARVAQLEGAAPPSRRPGESGPGGGQDASAALPEASPALAGEEAASDVAVDTPAPAGQGGHDPASPVTYGEFDGLVAAYLARREAEQREAWKSAARPKLPLREVSQKLALDPRQEASIRELYHQLERDSMKVLFQVDDAGLEALKAELAQAEHDPQVHARLREQVAVTWTRSSSEVGVLWVRLDARLRELLGPELLEDYYRYDVQLEDKEFPDVRKLLFPEQTRGED
jgi:hypothetical protein